MADDNQFGPHLSGVFDFTVLFEQSILSLLPSVLFVLLAPLRIIPLSKRDNCAQPGLHLWLKCATVAAYGCLQVALLVLWSTLDSATRTKTSIAEPAVAVVEAIAIALLSYFEHLKSTRPSALLNGYLVLTIILDIALARTFWIREGNGTIAAIFTVSLTCKSLLLIIEETPKKPAASSETSSGVISRSLFWWLNRMIYHGSQGLISVDDLDDINEKFESDKLLDTLEQRWKTYNKDDPLALLKCTFGAYKWQFAAGIIPRLMYSGFNYAQPFLIQAVIVSVGSPESPWSVKVASGLIGATLLIFIGRAVSNAWYQHMSFQMVTMYRGGLVSLIYKKTLDLQASSVKENAPVTLMTTDMDIIVGAGSQAHNMWASFIELPVGIYLLYRQVGYPSLLILVPTLVTTILSGIIAVGMEPATVAWNAAIQTRVGHTTSMLNQMKGIKMMGLTDHFRRLIQGLRIEEIRVNKRIRWLSAYLIALATCSNELTPLVVILSTIYWTRADQGLSVTETFTSLSIIALASQPLLAILASLVQMAGVFGGFMRIQTFLLLNEHKDLRATARSSKGIESFKSGEPLNSAFGLSPVGSLSIDEDLEMRPMSPFSVPRSDTSSPAIEIHDATFTNENGDVLLHDITMSVKQGTVTMIVSRVGGGKSLLLKAMIGELTPVNGMVITATKSSAYCDQIPWLQNATIRDNIVGPSLVDEDWLSAVIRACALDQDISKFEKGAMSLVGSGGIALSGGQKQRIALARAIYSRQRIVILDDVFSGLDSKTSRTVFNRLLGQDGLLRQSGATVVLSTSNPTLLVAADYITVLETGRIVHNQVSYDALDASELVALVEGQGGDEQEDEATTTVVRQIQSARTNEETPQEGDLLRQTGDTECYRIYLRSLGWGFVVFLFAMTVLGAVLEVMPRVWLKVWTQKGAATRDAGYLGGYIAFVLASMIAGASMLMVFIMVGIPRSALKLHESLLTSVCRAPLYFFTTTDSGTTLNRFSQDMTLVDQELPLAFILTVLLAFRAIAQAGVVASGARYVGAFIPLLVAALYLVQKYYLRTSRQMRFLNIEMKAPLYTQFTETLTGVATVRAFGWSRAFLDENSRKLNTSQKPFYMMFCIQRWLQVVLDLFVAGLALVLVSIALRVMGATSQGAIGLALISLLDFSQTLTVLIDQWTQLETSLGAIARLKWFVENTPNENKPTEDQSAPSDWPARGAIEFENVNASYNDTMDPVLRDISLKIKPGQKVGVCGRSGSGKTSLVLALVRLLEVQSGTIRIDGVDLSTLPRQYIRSHLSCIPQDSLNINGSVRGNLDPEQHVQSDEILIEALRKTAMWPVIEPRGGLDADMAELGLSSGQQQLFCLARAMLSRNRIVLLDEVTSSVDRETDGEVRRVIREQMEGKTVIEVAHRLEIVKDFDIVVVMGEGRVLEAGNPTELLGRTSEFRSLWASQGL